MRPVRNKRGFTLLEILVAVTLLSIGLLGMAGLTVAIMQGNTISRKVTTATALAQDKMEEMKKKGYSLASSETGSYGDITGYALYRRDTVVTPNSPGPGMKTVKVTVFWDSDAASLSMETILAE